MKRVGTDRRHAQFRARRPGKSGVRVAYRTKRGLMFHGPAEVILASPLAKRYRGKVQLIFTSPPFPLNRKKKYGNVQGQAYVEWLASFAPVFREFLKRDGSIVIELGNAWAPGQPVMSTLSLEALLAFCKKGEFHLCQQFICHNPARLPTPAQWVNVERIRMKDSYTHIWWMSPSDRPKADNRRVLKEYSFALFSFFVLIFFLTLTLPEKYWDEDQNREFYWL